MVNYILIVPFLLLMKKLQLLWMVLLLHSQAFSPVVLSVPSLTNKIQ